MPRSTQFWPRAGNIQKSADRLTHDRSLLDPTQDIGPGDFGGQIDDLGVRIHVHMIEVVGAKNATSQQTINLALKDSVVALNGIIVKVRGESPETTPDELEKIAGNSYSVLSGFALDNLLKCRDRQGTSLRGLNSYLLPHQLDFVKEDGQRPEHVTIAGDYRAPEGTEMPCSAFVGPRGEGIRMPRHTWQGVINIFGYCDRFRPGFEATLTGESPPVAVT